MQVAVVGADGQLGSDLVRAAEQRGWQVVQFTHADLEVTDRDSVAGAFAPVSCDLVVNTAALHDVERCEREPDTAFAVNAIGARNVAAAAAGIGAAVAYVSTDYVFDGRKGAPYSEADMPGPLNAYGVSKLAGEHMTAAANPRHFVIRTSALYGLDRCRGKAADNFVRLMLRLAREQGHVRVVTDERMSPTHTADVARQILEIGGTQSYGLYHATSQGECSWYEFAAAIFDLSGLQTTLAPASSADFPAKVPRPGYSVLENAALRALSLDRMPYWREALRAYLAESGELRQAHTESEGAAPDIPPEVAVEAADQGETG